MSALDGHATAERRSLAYHRAVAARLDEPLRERARATLERWRAAGVLPEPYAEQWRHALGLPLEELAAAIVAEDQAARDLRQCTPFAGVLAPAERWAILREVA